MKVRGFVCRAGGGTSYSLTDVGERLLILVRMCKCLFFTVRWDVLRTRREASVFNTVEDICTKFTDKYRPLFPIFPLFSFFSPCAHTRSVIWGTLHARFVQSLFSLVFAPPDTHTHTLQAEMSSVSNPAELCDPDWTRSETSELSSSLNHAKETCFFFLIAQILLMSELRGVIVICTEWLISTVASAMFTFHLLLIYDPRNADITLHYRFTLN